MKGMNGALLSNAIHAANALLEPHRVPRKLEIDDHPAAMMQVKSFAGRICREQQSCGAAGERIDGSQPVATRQPAMQLQCRFGKLAGEPCERVPVFRENDRRFVDATEETPKRMDFRLRLCG